MSYQINASMIMRMQEGGTFKILWNKLFVYIHMVKGYSGGLWI